MTEELNTKSWVTPCPHCHWWQSKPALNFGKKIENSKCIYCHKNYKVAVGGSLVNSQEASGIVRAKNMEGKGFSGFGNFKYKT